MGKVKIRRMPTEAFLSEKDETGFVDHDDMFEVFDAVAFYEDGSLILSGPKGIGKSLSFQSYAAMHGYPIVTYTCSETDRHSSLVGQFILQGNHTPFILGPLATAIEIANEAGHCILCLDEINALPPSSQKIINPLTDFHRSLNVPTVEQLFKLDDGAKLWVVGTMNSVVYGGVYSLNDDLTSRFNVLPLGYPSAEAEKKIIRSILPQLNTVQGRQWVDSVVRLGIETRQQAFEYALSPRDVIQILGNIFRVGSLEIPMMLAAGKFQLVDEVLFRKRVHSIFAINI